MVLLPRRLNKQNIPLEYRYFEPEQSHRLSRFYTRLCNFSVTAVDLLDSLAELKDGYTIKKGRLILQSADDAERFAAILERKINERNTR